MPALKTGTVCAFITFLVDGNTRRAVDDLPLEDYKAAYHLLLLQAAHFFCVISSSPLCHCAGQYRRQAIKTKAVWTPQLIRYILP